MLNHPLVDMNEAEKEFEKHNTTSIPTEEERGYIGAVKQSFRLNRCSLTKTGDQTHLRVADGTGHAHFHGLVATLNWQLKHDVALQKLLHKTHHHAVTLLQKGRWIRSPPAFDWKRHVGGCGLPVGILVRVSVLRGGRSCPPAHAHIQLGVQASSFPCTRKHAHCECTSHMSAQLCLGQIFRWTQGNKGSLTHHT
jgi:hypothetical protein